VFGGAGADRLAVLWGDSMAAQWFPAASATFVRPGWRLVVITKSACPVAAVPVRSRRDERPDLACERWRRDAAGWIAGQKPDVLVLGSADAYPVAPAQWQAGLAVVLDAVAPVAGRVFVLAPTPTLPYSGTHCLARRAWQGDASRLACAAPADTVRRPLRDALAGAVGKRDDVALVVLDDAACPAGRCAAERDGAIVFRDNAHLTARHVAAMAPLFERRLRELGWDPDASTPR
jgi:hypothetical protein